MDCRSDEALKALGSRGFDAQVTASLEHRRFEMVGASRGGHYVGTEPGDQRFAIGDRGFTEAAVLPNLRPVILDGPPVPGILRPHVSGHADLLGEMVDHGQGHVLRRPWESPGILETFQQHGKAQARGAMLMLDQRPFSRNNGPVFH
jgi:hypothetical protein